MTIEEKFDDFIHGYYGQSVPAGVYVQLYDAFAAGVVLANQRLTKEQLKDGVAQFIARHLERLQQRSESTDYNQEKQQILKYINEHPSKRRKDKATTRQSNDG